MGAGTRKILWSACGAIAASVVGLNLFALGYPDRSRLFISLSIAAASLLLGLIGALRSQRRGLLPDPPDTVSSPTLSAHLLNVQEEERRTLSRELHDGVGQSVTALKMELARIQPADAESQRRLERTRAIAGEVLQVIRNVSLLLRPTILDDLGLQDALQWHAEDFSRRTSIPCSLHYGLADSESLPDSIRTCVYRSVQEALNNCEKHASPHSVSIRVAQVREALVVTIADDGNGLADQARDAAGLGILGMRERAAMLGGTLDIQSATGAGTTVTLSVPYPSSRKTIQGRETPVSTC